MNALRIAWLFPDTLYLHGERGNILALERFAKLAGFEVRTDKVDFDTEGFSPMDYDIIFCPPGEITSFPEILKWLKPYADEFAAFIEAGRPMLVTGTSVALWCRSVKRTDGSSFEGMGLLAADAAEKDTVYGDDLYYSCTVKRLGENCPTATEIPERTGKRVLSERTLCLPIPWRRFWPCIRILPQSLSKLPQQQRGRMQKSLRR